MKYLKKFAKRFIFLKKIFKYNTYFYLGSDGDHNFAINANFFESLNSKQQNKVYQRELESAQKKNYLKFRRLTK